MAEVTTYCGGGQPLIQHQQSKLRRKIRAATIFWLLLCCVNLLSLYVVPNVIFHFSLLDLSFS